MRLALVDSEPSVVAAWRKAFSKWPDVRIHEGHILQVAVNTVVSPANSYGNMDGGIDLVYLQFFGPDLQLKVQRAIDRESDGMLAVGSAVFVETGHSQIPFLVVAPTMEIPGPTEPAKVFFAMSAALKVARRYRKVVTDLYCPGLGTGVGELAPDDSAREMATAYGKWLERN